MTGLIKNACLTEWDSLFLIDISFLIDNESISSKESIYGHNWDCIWPYGSIISKITTAHLFVFDFNGSPRWLCALINCVSKSKRDT
jgi:hypothetical protein